MALMVGGETFAERFARRLTRDVDMSTIGEPVCDISRMPKWDTEEMNRRQRELQSILPPIEYAED